LIGSSVRPVVRFLVWKPYYDHKVWSWCLRLAKAIPIWTSPHDVARAIERARGELEMGQILCVFAEGSISRTGDLLPFKRGLESIVRGLEVPIVPVHLDGLWESVFSFEGGRFLWKRPRRLRHPVVISFGAPLPASSTANKVRQAVQELGAHSLATRSASVPGPEGAPIGSGQRLLS
jgi:acyl-[acyl-carrier-protein]-phospholipid O-acyltransferase/long-chain-fatty-acid--[acyl-carrier-protein] ligase